MMKLIGEKLRQYDLNRTVELIPKHGFTVETVFFYKNSPEPLVVAHREEDGKIIADIPNIFLKAFGTLSVEVHLVDGNGYRISKQASFYVSKREMPEDYVYEETPVLKLGSGGGGVTDYNKLENVPCKAKTVEILPETTVEIDPEIVNGILPNVLDVKAGDKVAVEWNGNEYLCTAVQFPDPEMPAVCVGDVGLVTSGESTGEPFVIVFFDAESAPLEGAGTVIQPVDGSETVTLSISSVTVTQPLAPMYLPRLVVKFTKVNDNSSNNAVADKSFEEVMAAVMAGYEIACEYTYIEETSVGSVTYTLRSNDTVIANSVNDGVSNTFCMFNMVSYGSMCSIVYGSDNAASVAFKDL